MRGAWTTAMGLAAGLLTASPALAGEVQVPLEVGLGPATHTWLGAVAKDQPVHMGIVLTADVVLDRAWLRENKERVPARWRELAGAADEIRIRPLWYLPETLVISPKTADTGMVGASWRPLSVGMPLVTHPVRVGVDAGARLTALVVWSDSLPEPGAPSTTFFLRPGVDVAVDAIFPITETVRIRLGADAHAYVPQGLGTFGLGEPGARMAGLVRGFAEVRVRVPITVKR